MCVHNVVSGRANNCWWRQEGGGGLSRGAGGSSGEGTGNGQVTDSNGWGKDGQNF